MRVRFSGVVGLSFAVLLGLFLAFNIVAADKPAKMANLQGKVQMMSKDTSTITVEQKGGLRRQPSRGGKNTRASLCSKCSCSWSSGLSTKKPSDLLISPTTSEAFLTSSNRCLPFAAPNRCFSAVSFFKDVQSSAPT